MGSDPVPLSGGETAAPTPPVAPASLTQAAPEGGDIKQLVNNLTQIRSERARLVDRERQTVEQIKKKFHEQKLALQQVEKELRDMGITVEEAWEKPER